ncbi:MAG: hypothetical protein R3B54_15990 [Bdellovibrionota bacterium]
MKQTLFLMIAGLLLNQSVIAGEADQCASAPDKDICIANLLLTKLNRLILAGGGGTGETPLVRITYYDEANCTVDWATGFIPRVITTSSLPLIENTCREMADSMANLSVSNSAIESVRVGAQCLTLSPSIDRRQKEKVYADCLARSES